MISVHSPSKRRYTESVLGSDDSLEQWRRRSDDATSSDNDDTQETKRPANKDPLANESGTEDIFAEESVSQSGMNIAETGGNYVAHSSEDESEGKAIDLHFCMLKGTKLTVLSLQLYSGPQQHDLQGTLKRMERKMDKILDVLMTQKRASNEFQKKVTHELATMAQKQTVLDAKYVAYLKYHILSWMTHRLFPLRFLNKVEGLVDKHMPINSDDSMKLIFGDHRLWPSVILRLQNRFNVSYEGKYDSSAIRNNIFGREYFLSRTLTDVKRSSGKDVSFNLPNVPFRITLQRMFLITGTVYARVPPTHATLHL